MVRFKVDLMGKFDQHLSTCQLPENEEDVVQFPEISLMFREQGSLMMRWEARQLTAKTFRETSETSSAQPEEEDSPSTQTTSCVNLGQAFHQLQKEVLLILQRREDSERPTKSHHQLARKRKRCLGKRIQPQEPLEY